MTNALDLRIPVDTLAMEYTREFEAPVDALFRAHADPELVKRWLGPRGMEVTVDRWDFTAGGGYRYSDKDENGEYVFTGVFHTVRTNELVVQTFEFEGAPDSVNVEYLWFEDLGGGRSRLRARSIFPNAEALEGMRESGMEIGISEGYEQLDELLAAQ